MALDYILRNCSAFADGVGLHGAIASLTLPKLKEKLEEHRGGGMDAPIDVALGYEKLEGGFELVDYDPQVLGLWGLRPGVVKAFTFKGYLVGETGTEREAEVHMRGRVSELDAGEWKPGELAKLKAMLSLAYHKTTIGGVVIQELDVTAGIRVIGGIDQNSGMRRALGIA